jgi:hypothetical protein
LGWSAQGPEFESWSSHIFFKFFFKFFRSFYNNIYFFSSKMATKPLLDAFLPALVRTYNAGLSFALLLLSCSSCGHINQNTLKYYTNSNVHRISPCSNYSLASQPRSLAASQPRSLAALQFDQFRLDFLTNFDKISKLHALALTNFDLISKLCALALTNFDRIF